MEIRCIWASNYLINTKWEVTIWVKVEKSFFKFFNNFSDLSTILNILLSISSVWFTSRHLIQLVLDDHGRNVHIFFILCLSNFHLFNLSNFYLALCSNIGSYLVVGSFGQNPLFGFSTNVLPHCTMPWSWNLSGTTKYFFQLYLLI